jgi:hypothetical protein
MAHQEIQYLPHQAQQTDEWHTHTPDEGQPQHEHGAKANPAILIAVTLGFVVAVALTVLLTSLYFGSYMTSQKRAKSETTILSEDYRAYRAQSEAALSGYGWADPAAGTVRVPIDRAIDKVITSYQGN